MQTLAPDNHSFELCSPSLSITLPFVSNCQSLAHANILHSFSKQANTRDEHVVDRRKSLRVLVRAGTPACSSTERERECRELYANRPPGAVDESWAFADCSSQDKAIGFAHYLFLSSTLHRNPSPLNLQPTPPRLELQRTDALVSDKPEADSCRKASHLFRSTDLAARKSRQLRKVRFRSTGYI